MSVGSGLVFLVEESHQDIGCHRAWKVSRKVSPAYTLDAAFVQLRCANRGYVGTGWEFRVAVYERAELMDYEVLEE